MGKTLIQQARGKGGPTYRSPGHRFKGAAKHKSFSRSVSEGKIVDLVLCPGHSAPLAKIKYEDNEEIWAIAPEGVRVGDSLYAGPDADVKKGNTVSLKNIPEGTLVYNIESKPGDGGKFVRSSGTFAKVVTRNNNKVTLQLPSKKQKLFDENCRASIGIVAGAGRPEKPFMKAGKKFHARKARNLKYPSVSGTSMNSVDHPFGGSSSHHKGKPTIAPKNAPPGAKVGKIRPRQTGKRK